MHVTIRTFTIPGKRSREPLHQAAVYATIAQDAAPLMRSDWSQRESEVFKAALNWARRNSYIVSNSRSGSFYGIAAGR
ncbi:CDP-diacylglycerol pyrophosphatase [Cupriavidus lacunae]|uniref:CDP-diacylglycerol pyrophosphatase n=1 Tax=Cupriavidus lacunae TaxID=2666307 RepID=A0A370NKI9_9BURK|nr:CDP-diacylglycerol pyrophosphatase [Cupriavidus lacunae]